MASDAPLSGIELHPEQFLGGNHTRLISQLSEEVGYLRGVLDSIDVKSDRLTEILANALRYHSELAAIRRAGSVVKDGGQ